MADPFATRFDLMPGNVVPYTDDPDGYDPTDALAVYSLPKLDPTVDNSNAPQDQSAALLDQSAFAPMADLATLAPTPPGAVKATTPSGDAFWVPKDSNFNDVYQAGQSIQNKPLSDQLTAIGNNIGHGGTFDFQRQGGAFNGNYTDASNFAVGVYMNGAGYSWPETKALGDIYAYTHDKNGLPPGDEVMWRAGYDAANSGKLP